MGTIERIAKFVAARRPWAAIAAFSLFCNAGCADILGIESPEPKMTGSNGVAGQSSVDQPDDAGSGGEAPNSPNARAPLAAAGSAGSAGNSELIIGGPDTLAVCPGADATLHLRAEGGQGPYVWKISDTHPVFTVSAPAPHTEQATLVGMLTEPGPLSMRVHVVDSNGLEAVRTLTVSGASVPVIRVPQPLSVCPNELYALDLKAFGGDGSNYQWSTDLPESTGLTISGQQLRGTFRSATSTATRLKFQLNVRDGSCPGTPLALSLNVQSPTATDCTSAYMADHFSNKPIPQPCSSDSYNQQLLADGGVGPFQWSVSSLPAGLNFEPSTAKISGKISAPGTLTVQLKDTKTNRTTETSFALEPRDKCWFSYVSTETGSSRLHLFDPVLGNRRTFPQAGNLDPVTDFKFSPNGELLAYRLGPSGGPLSLSIIKLRTWQEQRFNLANVRYYEWSADSKTLAVVYGSSVSMLGGVNVDAEFASEPGSSSGLVFPTLVGTATPVDSKPVWFDGNQLAFFSFIRPVPTAVPAAVALNVSTLGQTSFGAPKIYPEFYLPDVRLKPADAGIFTVEPYSDTLYYGSDGSDALPHRDVVIAPSGRYVARPDQHSLQLFRAVDSTSALHPIAPASQAGCDGVLAWAAGRERIACSHPGAPHDELTFFDVDSSNDLPLLSSAATLELPGAASDLTGRSRLFSQSGAHFVFMGPDSISIAKFDGGTPSFEYIRALEPANDPFTELVFSPNEQLLLLHRGKDLLAFDLRNSENSAVQIPDVLSPAPACTEDVKQATSWCGSLRAEAPILWAPGSDFAAYQNEQGTLQIYEFSPLYPQTIPVNDQCGTGCITAGQFAFQP